MTSDPNRLGISMSKHFKKNLNCRDRDYQKQPTPQYNEEPEPPSYPTRPANFSRSGRQPPVNRPQSRSYNPDYEQNYPPPREQRDNYNPNFQRTKSATGDSRMDRSQNYNHSQSYDPRYDERRYSFFCSYK